MLTEFKPFEERCDTMFQRVWGPIGEPDQSGQSCRNRPFTTILVRLIENQIREGAFLARFASYPDMFSEHDYGHIYQ